MNAIRNYAKSIGVEAEIAIISENYGLNEQEFCEMLETLGCITREQRNKIITICTAFAVKDMIENRTKSL